MALVTVEIDVRAVWILARFGFVFWESNRVEGVKGEMRSEENGGE